MSPEPDSSGRPTASLTRAAPFVVAIVVLAAFLPALHNGFVSWDDANNFVDNPAYRGLGAPQLKWMWTTTLMGHYVPLTWMTLGLDYELWGMNPAGYHLTSLVLHTANAVLVYFIAGRLLHEANPARFADGARRVAAASAAALLWAVHPLRVESVAWATERRDVLSCLFFLSSILAYLRAIDAPRTIAHWYWFAVGLFVCSVLSKATSMSLPVVLLMLSVYPLRRLGGEVGWWSADARRVYRELIPFGAIAVAAALVSLSVLHPPAQLTLAAKIAVSTYSLVFYLVKTVAPFRLSPLYEMPQHVDPTAILYLVSDVLVIAGIAALWIVRRRRPGLTAAVAAFTIITLPMLGIVQNGPQIAADRYTYYGGPALAIGAAGWLFSLEQSLLPSLGVVAGAILAGLGVLTWRQTTVWHDSSTLWSRVVSLDPNSSFGHAGLARLAFDRGDMDDAIRHYERAVAIDPGYAEGFNNMGNALLREGKVDDAIREYRHALDVKPTFAEAHNDLGSALVQEGDVPDAIEQYRLALAVQPRYAEARNNWGAALARLGKTASAIEQYRAALAIDSTYADAYINWGNALVRLDQPAAAESRYAAAIRLRPDDADAHRNLGVALAQQGKLAEAAEHFRRAVELRPDDEQARAYLARVTADRGRP